MPETPSKPDDRSHEAADAPEKTGDKGHPENKQKTVSERLDEALEETFPSSDPVSVKITK